MGWLDERAVDVTKLCKDCKHFERGMNGAPHKCFRVAKETIEPVFGEKYTKGILVCESERKAVCFRCGPDGQFWEAKEE